MSGARCLVLGGSGALGQAVRRELSAKKAAVAYTFHQTKAEGAMAIGADLSIAGEVDRAVDEAVALLGGLDALVHCAAVSGMNEAGVAAPRLAELDAERFDRLMAVNLRSAFLACRRAAPHLGREGKGAIVLLGSLDGVKPMPSPVHFAVSKAALVGLTRSLAKELGEAGVRVNLVAPGVLDGGLSRFLPQAQVRDYLAHSALGRVGTLAEAARVVAHLALDPGYVSGQVFSLDGGL